MDQEIAMLNVRALHGVLHGYEGDLARRTEVLGRIVLDLLMEVEALRHHTPEPRRRRKAVRRIYRQFSDPGTRDANHALRRPASEKH